MKTYVIIKPYENDKSLIDLHLKYFKNRNPMYGFLYQRDHHATHLMIRVELDEVETSLLSLLFNIEVIRELLPNQTTRDIIERLDKFTTVGYFYMSNIESIVKNES